CAPDHNFPDVELALLAWTVRNNPVEGDGYDASGNKLHVRIDEGALLGYVIDNPTGNFTSTGELLAAAHALWRGDSVPLLRLGAEAYFPLEGVDNGDPTGFSYGADIATWNADFYVPWDWSADVDTRQQQYDSAVAALPWWYFQPFSKSAATGNLLFDFVLPGLWWEIPTPPNPIALPHADYPQVPTLVLSGDMDRRVPLEITTKVASLYPQSVFVKVPEAGHVSLYWSTCAANLASEFIRTLTVGDTSCANTPETVWPAVGRFPLFAREAEPAEIDKTGGNKIGTDERRVVTVAVATVTDAMQRMFFGAGDGVGLRGGTFHTEYDDLNPLTVTLTDCAFAGDVTVTGVATWSPGSPAVLGAAGDFSLVADLTVSGTGTKGGAIHIEGKWQAPGAVGKFRVTGSLGGKKVAVLVPEA
ncbi:MAG TPA: alpha/beta hydrolase, partial [Thermoanaerobaculia bacterium]|nr:alpha/beta hydrolase [Thermoanaerobaculia bacterium]